MNRLFFSAPFVFVASAALAADPYVSAGFLKFPDDVQLGAVSAVAIGKDDSIYVLHRGEPPLVDFAADGKFVRGWGQAMFKVPHGLRVDAAGNIWTTDNGNHVLRKFTPEGKLAATLGTEGKAGGGKQGFRAPDDLVFDSQGNMYVADSGNGRIVKLSGEGVYLAEWGKKGKGPGEFATAHGLAIDKDDRIYVADRGNKRIQVFDTSGKHLADWTGFGNPFGLLVVGDEVLASEGDIHKIFHLARLAPSPGKIVAQWGSPETLKLPHLMAVDSKGTLYVAEVNGQRVQMFRRSAP
jgi:DNA-binding beta-propeller fold protein YncE